ncbi:hypothetical protein SLEP1_g25506 [Rubroshorea leprosula]|uniref:Uncharacterized protein n=1 Tax=Rubroshorea leprosula TaxID=152421 RepID=A0AAV5JQE9_9ROSI|nr:hypothetical protein SLEP1_g25506 [Rubroshorea leprosula]
MNSSLVEGKSIISPVLTLWHFLPADDHELAKILK